MSEKIEDVAGSEPEASKKGKKQTAESIAAAYFKAHPLYREDAVIVTEDGTVFPGGLKGENSALNYCKDKTGANGQMGFAIISR
jgi:hypothetical protein